MLASLCSQDLEVYSVGSILVVDLSQFSVVVMTGSCGKLEVQEEVLHSQILVLVEHVQATVAVLQHCSY